MDCECAALNVARTLDRLLAGTDLGYVEIGSQIVVVPRAEPETPGADGEFRSRVRAVATMVGVVRDSVDLEPVASARVSVAPSGSEAVAASGFSDRFGAFVVPGVSTGGPVRIEVSAFGYATWARTYEAVPSDPVRVLLGPAPIALEGLDVIASGRAGDPLSLSRDAFVIDSALLRRLPTIVETDVLRAIAVSPSASASSDYISVPFVRGGASDGTPVLLDGVRLFNAFHLGGFISAINPEAVERATLLAGSGGEGLAIGSLSGAIDIATRDGSRDRMRMVGALGALSSRLSIEGPVGESVSFLVDGRRSWIDGFTRALDKMGGIDGHSPYFYRDLHAKVTADLGGVRRLSFSGYMNSESVDDVDAREQVTRQLAMTWGNAAFSGHYRTGFGGNGILDATLGHSRFTGDLFHVEDHPQARDDGGMLYDPPPDTGLFGHGSMGESRADLKVTMHAPGATIIAGAQATRVEADHDYRFSEDCYASCSWDFMDLSDFFVRRLYVARDQVAPGWLFEDRGPSARRVLGPGRGAAGPLRGPGDRILALRGAGLHRVLVERAHLGGPLAPGAGLGAERGVAVCKLRSLRSPRPRGRTTGSPQHRVHGRVGGFAGTAQDSAGRLCAQTGQPQAAGVRVQPDPSSGAGESCAVGAGQRFGARNRGDLELAAGSWAFRSGDVPVGQGVANRVYAELYAALSPRT